MVTKGAAFTVYGFKCQRCRPPESTKSCISLVFTATFVRSCHSAAVNCHHAPHRVLWPGKRVAYEECPLSSPTPLSIPATHISSQAKGMAMQSVTRGRRATPRPPERPSQALPVVNMMDPAIQAEIARQVALALHREHQGERFSSAVEEEPAKGARLIRFPGAG
jgi:hypothetical protein